MRPVLGGSSYSSQDDLELTFGLGSAGRGVAEILWPGGVRNRFYNVHSEARILFPEIPCSFDAAWPSVPAYIGCVRTALDELRDAGILDRREQARFFSSAILAFLDAG